MCLKGNSLPQGRVPIITQSSRPRLRPVAPERAASGDSSLTHQSGGGGGGGALTSATRVQESEGREVKEEGGDKGGGWWRKWLCLLFRWATMVGCNCPLRACSSVETSVSIYISQSGLRTFCPLPITRPCLTLFVQIEPFICSHTLKTLFMPLNVYLCMHFFRVSPLPYKAMKSVRANQKWESMEICVSLSLSSPELLEEEQRKRLFSAYVISSSGVEEHSRRGSEPWVTSHQ